MEAEKLQFILNGGISSAEVTIREGQAIKLLDPKPPIKTNLSGVIWAPYEYLLRRLGCKQINIDRAYVEVNREDVSIKLTINEDDDYINSTVKGVLEVYPKFTEFGINTGKKWTPASLGLFFKMNRSFFSDTKINMQLVTKLMSYTATINTKVDQHIKENGNKTDNFSQVVNSNLPEKFNLNIPLFKGFNSETIEVETFAIVDGRDVSLTLISPGAVQVLEATRNKVIDEQIEKIRSIAPQIVIIEV